MIGSVAYLQEISKILPDFQAMATAMAACALQDSIHSDQHQGEIEGLNVFFSFA
jgi:hypothetical protein